MQESHSVLESFQTPADVGTQNTGGHARSLVLTEIGEMPVGVRNNAVHQIGRPGQEDTQITIEELPDHLICLQADKITADAATESTQTSHIGHIERGHVIGAITGTAIEIATRGSAAVTVDTPAVDREVWRGGWPCWRRV